VAGEGATRRHDRCAQGGRRLGAGRHEAAICAGHGQPQERAAARSHVVEDGAHDELGLGGQPRRQVVTGLVGLGDAGVGQDGGQPRARIEAGGPARGGTPGFDVRGVVGQGSRPRRPGLPG
jgi:hypothetical protein